MFCYGKAACGERKTYASRPKQMCVSKLEAENEERPKQDMFRKMQYVIVINTVYNPNNKTRQHLNQI